MQLDLRWCALMLTELTRPAVTVSFTLLGSVHTWSHTEDMRGTPRTWWT